MCLYMCVCVYLQDDDVVVTEGAELSGPGSVSPDHLVDQILKVQRELLHTHSLTHTHTHTHILSRATYSKYRDIPPMQVG